eukprot:TRINITY_DN20132_c0_g1_i1.p1 TRINITY_DN20132_c0_g1~~TRINITY_DN20132_c0_g1_i1.p1  ORF type:complete len:316 (-),score=92.10 TRINITY_DN20132_c0_g1_i1:151-1098(-)
MAVELVEEAMQLSEVSKAIDGSGFAYSRLDCISKRIGSIKVLEQYPYLRQIDLSKNCIEDVTPVGKLNHILSLNLASNSIVSVDAWKPDPHAALQHLLYLDLSGNKLQALPKLHMPALRRANFSQNEISTCKDFGGHPRLQTLMLSQNKLESVEGLVELPELLTLQLAENSLASLDGLRALPRLASLDLSTNKFASLEGPWGEMAQLESLNVNSNTLPTAAVFAPLGGLAKLRTVQVAGNPLEEEEGINVRLELLIFQGNLGKINDEEVAPEEKEDAIALNQKRIEEEEERRRAEEEARLAAEAAAAEGEGGEES